MRRFDAAERRARLAVRHHLAPGHAAPDARTVAHDLVAVHASDPSSVHVAILARADVTIADVERALYDERTLLRLLGMRRTVFVTTTGIAPVVQVAASADVAAAERRKVLKGVGEEWLAEMEQRTLTALERRGEATAAELSDEDPGLEAEIVLLPGTKWEGRQRIGARALFLLAAQGRVVRGRPRGSWTSSQYAWSTMENWVGTPETPADAELELARRWLAAYGPATVEDLKWWTGWTLTRTRKVLARLGPAEVEIEDAGPGIALADDLEDTGPVEPWAALLPALDPTAMGWTDRDFYLGGHAPRLRDRSHNMGPTVWWDGRVVGTWVQDDAGRIRHHLAEDVGAEAEEAIAAAAQRMTGHLGDVRLTARARGRSPLELEAAGS